MKERLPDPNYQWPRLENESPYEWAERVEKIKDQAPYLNEYVLAGFYGFVICGVLGDSNKALLDTIYWCHGAGLKSYDDWYVPNTATYWDPMVVWFKNSDVALQFSLSHDSMKVPEYLDYINNVKTSHVL